jgi:hypothetical protein
MARDSDFPRANRRIGRALSIGGVGVVFTLLLMNSAQGALPISSVAFPRATWSPFQSKDVQGCSRGSTLTPSWSRGTGDGRILGSGRAATCRGQPDIYASSVTIDADLTVSVPRHLTRGPGGVNVTWDLVGTGSTAGGVAGSRTCPATTYTSDYDLGYTWQNFTDVSADCYALATVSLWGSSVLVDITTGQTISAANAWAGVSNTSGLENYSYSYREVYSNASYWTYNTSGAYSFNQSNGASGTLNGRWMPTWFLNGSFVPTDRYAVESLLEIEVSCEASGFPMAMGDGGLDLSSGSNHADLASIVSW